MENGNGNGNGSGNGNGNIKDNATCGIDGRTRQHRDLLNTIGTDY